MIIVCQIRDLRLDIPYILNIDQYRVRDYSGFLILTKTIKQNCLLF